MALGCEYPELSDTEGIKEMPKLKDNYNYYFLIGNRRHTIRLDNREGYRRLLIDIQDNITDGYYFSGVFDANRNTFVLTNSPATTKGVSYRKIKE